MSNLSILVSVKLSIFVDSKSLIHPLGDTDTNITFDDYLEESFTMAKKAIQCNKFWWKGYFYAARALQKNDQKESSLKYMKLLMTNETMMASAQVHVSLY